MSPTSFMFVRKAPDLEAIRAARREERKRAKRSVEESKEVTYKVLKPGSGPWQVRSPLRGIARCGHALSDPGSARRRGRP